MHTTDRTLPWIPALSAALLMSAAAASSAQRATETAVPRVRVEVTARVDTAESSSSTLKQRGGRPAPAVLWLKPLTPGAIGAAAEMQHDKYTLLQKNKMFVPHLLVVPVGSVVLFPNADPYFHNVFSLFEGKRFDLGLYEAGKTKEVTFSREGVSYIFCNIHSEMSAVVIALSTPYYSIADASGVFHLHDVPADEYEVHLWVEGEEKPLLDQAARRVRISTADGDLGTIRLTAAPHWETHTNKFGQPYEPETKPSY